jgi:hypothetical protein
MVQHIFIHTPSTKFHENPFNHSRILTRAHGDERKKIF